MYSLPIHSQGISISYKLGNTVINISIDTYKDSEGYTLVDFTISEPLRHIKTITLISTLSYSSVIQLLSPMLATLTRLYIEDGKEFGDAAYQTFNRHYPNSCLFCTS